MVCETGQVLESEVVRLWQEQMQRQRRLADINGDTVEVVYPGRPNDSRGGDFQDAVVDSSQGCQFGCIEIHTRTSAWQDHGHHRNSDYNRVVLHVALEQDRSEPTRLQNGRIVPTVVLNQQPLSATGGIPCGHGLPCQNIRNSQDAESRQKMLETAGDQRLAARIRQYEDKLNLECAGQTLYAGFLESLGYSRNKAPFLKLACEVTLSSLEDLMSHYQREDEYLIHLQAFILGKAGLLPSQRCLETGGEAYPSRLEQVWAEYRSPPVMSVRDWEMYRVRPGNHPVRRIIALSYLLRRFQRAGWVRSLAGLIRRSSLSRAQSEIESKLEVPAEGYWAGHYDFGQPGPVHATPVLLGRQRISEIVINVLLPFSLALGRATRDHILENKALALYLRYPRLETNSIERHMLQQLSVPRRLAKSARCQQGLLHIYKSLCTQGKCNECILSGIV